MAPQTITIISKELSLLLERVSFPFHQDTLLYIISNGFHKLNHPELVLILGGYTYCPSAITLFYRSLWRYTIENHCRLDQKDFTEFSTPILGAYSGFAYSNQPLPKYIENPPIGEYLVCIGLTKEELYYSKKYGTARVLANLARVFKYYPTPCWNHPEDALRRRVFYLGSGIDQKSAPDGTMRTDFAMHHSKSILDEITLITWPNVYVYVENLKHLIIDIDIHTSPLEVIQDLKGIIALSERELLQSNDLMTIAFAIKTTINSDIPAHICWRGDAPSLHRGENGNVCIVSKPGNTSSAQLGGSFVAFSINEDKLTFKTLEDGFCVFLTPQKLRKVINECIRIAQSMIQFLEDPQNGRIRNEMIMIPLSDGYSLRIKFPTESQIRSLIHSSGMTKISSSLNYVKPISEINTDSHKRMIELSSITLLSTQEDFNQRTNEEEHGRAIQKVFLSLRDYLQKVLPASETPEPKIVGSTISSIHVDSSPNSKATASSGVYGDEKDITELKDKNEFNEIIEHEKSNETNIYSDVQKVWMFEIVVTEDGTTGLRSFSTSKKYPEKKKRDFVKECIVFLNSRHSRHKLKQGPTLKFLLDFIVFRDI